MMSSSLFIPWPSFWGKGQAILAAALVFTLLGTGGCGRIDRVPAVLEAESYEEVSFSQLRDSREAERLRGRRVKFAAFFWQYLHYDPAILRNYAMLAGHPISWWDLKWASVYETPQMQGFYDRLALDGELQGRLKLKRLDRLLIFGEVAPMGPGLTYVRLHRVEKLEPN